MCGKPLKLRGEEIRLCADCGVQCPTVSRLVVSFWAHGLATLLFYLSPKKIWTRIRVSTSESGRKELVGQYRALMGQLEHPWQIINTISQGFAIVIEVANGFGDLSGITTCSRAHFRDFLYSQLIKEESLWGLSQSPMYTLQTLAFPWTVPGISKETIPSINFQAQKSSW